MFGSKKHKLEAQIRIREILSKVTEQKENFENSAARVEETRKRIETDVCQVVENTKGLAGYARTNIEEENKLIRSLDGVSDKLENSIRDYEQIAGLVKEQFDAAVKLAEEQKHYTTPSKALKAVPEVMKQQAALQKEQLDNIVGDGRKINVLALNAAIEAGHMDDGKQFVAVCEDIRQISMEFENMAIGLREELEESENKIAELEETVQYLVSVLKDSNIAASHLLKKGQELNKAVENAAMPSFSDDFVLVRDKIIGMRNLDEEIAKCEERNQIQFSDIQEDLQVQKNMLTELQSNVINILHIAEEELKSNEEY